PCIFHRHLGVKRTDGETLSGAVGSFIYTPASIPMIFHGAAASNQGSTTDFLAGLRRAQEIEAQLAGLAAHKAAQDAGDKAVQDVLTRASSGMSGLSGVYGARAQGAEGQNRI